MCCGGSLGSRSSFDFNDLPVNASCCSSTSFASSLVTSHFLIASSRLARFSVPTQSLSEFSLNMSSYPSLAGSPGAHSKLTPSLSLWCIADHDLDPFNRCWKGWNSTKNYERNSSSPHLPTNQGSQDLPTFLQRYPRHEDSIHLQRWFFLDLLWVSSFSQVREESFRWLQIVNFVRYVPLGWG